MLIVAVVIMVVVITRHLGRTRRARAKLTSGEEYRALAGEFLRLTDISVQVDALRDQLDHMQLILKEVE